MFARGSSLSAWSAVQPVRQVNVELGLVVMIVYTVDEVAVHVAEAVVPATPFERLVQQEVTHTVAAVMPIAVATAVPVVGAIAGYAILK